MEVILSELKDINSRLVGIAMEVLNRHGLPEVIETNFLTTIRIGFDLIEYLPLTYGSKTYLPPVISLIDIGKIENFFIKCEYSIGFAGEEISETHCDFEEDLESFEGRRLFSMRYLRQYIVN